MRTKDHPLVGKFVTFYLSRQSRFGYYGGFVRAVDVDRKDNLIGLSVQMAGGEQMVSGKSASARYRGEVLKIVGRELETACRVVRGKARPIFGE